MYYHGICPHTIAYRNRGLNPVAAPVLYLVSRCLPFPRGFNPVNRQLLLRSTRLIRVCNPLCHAVVQMHTYERVKSQGTFVACSTVRIHGRRSVARGRIINSSGEEVQLVENGDRQASCEPISMVHASQSPRRHRHTTSYVGEHILRVRTRFIPYFIPGTWEKGKLTVKESPRSANFLPVT